MMMIMLCLLWTDEPPLCAAFGPGGFGREAPDQWTGEQDLPMVPEILQRQLQRDCETRTIDIDGKPREIRTYGCNAIVLMDAFDPRTLSFENGSCEVVFDEGEFVLEMNTNDDYKMFNIGDDVHRVRLGVPTQELFLNGKGYQCFFGGKPITVYLSNRTRTIRLVGKPPNVAIGKKINNDFLFGKVSLVINANTKRVIPIYLDAKPQKLFIDNRLFILKFINQFRAIRLNTIPFPIQFGGLPISISVRQLRKFLSFSHLPPGVIPGKSTVIGMDSDLIMPTFPDPQRNTISKSLEASPGIHGIRPPPMPPNLPLFPAPPRLAVPKSTDVGSVAPPPPFPKLADAPATDTDARTDEFNVKKGVIPGSYITNAGPSASPPPRSATPRAATPAPLPNMSSAPIDVSNLLHSLIKHGIIGKPASPNTVTIDDDEEPVVDAPKEEEKAKPLLIKVKKLEELKQAPPEPEVLLDENDRDWLEVDEGVDFKSSNVSKMDHLFKSQQLRKYVHNFFGNEFYMLKLFAKLSAVIL